NRRWWPCGASCGWGLVGSRVRPVARRHRMALGPEPAAPASTYYTLCSAVFTPHGARPRASSTCQHILHTEPCWGLGACGHEKRPCRVVDRALGWCLSGHQVLHQNDGAVLDGYLDAFIGVVVAEVSVFGGDQHPPLLRVQGFFDPLVDLFGERQAHQLRPVGVGVFGESQLLPLGGAAGSVEGAENVVLGVLHGCSLPVRVTVDS